MLRPFKAIFHPHTPDSEKEPSSHACAIPSKQILALDVVYAVVLLSHDPFLHCRESRINRITSRGTHEVAWCCC